MQQDAKGKVPSQTVAANDELTRKYDEITLELIGLDVFFTLVFILSLLYSLRSSFESVELINRKYQEPKTDPAPKAQSLSPSTTALTGTMVGAIATVGLAWTAYLRLNQQAERRELGLQTGEIWPQILIVITGFIFIIISALRIIAVRQKQLDEAQVVIL